MVFITDETHLKDVFKPSHPRAFRRFGPISELSVGQTGVLIYIGLRWLRVKIPSLCVTSDSAGI